MVTVRQLCVGSQPRSGSLSVTVTLLSFQLSLFQLARQRTTMHPEPAGGLRDIESRLYQHLMDALPLQALDGSRARAQRDVDIPLASGEGLLDIIGVGRLGEIVSGAQLDGFDRRGNTGEAG